MQGLSVRIARRLNALWKRAGSVFAERYHDVILRTPRQVRNAVRYVLLNARKHGAAPPGIDPYSSGPWFDGWREKIRERVESSRPVALARTWLLAVGWRRHGPISCFDVPGGRPRRRLVMDSAISAQSRSAAPVRPSARGEAPLDVVRGTAENGRAATAA